MKTDNTRSRRRLPTFSESYLLVISIVHGRAEYHNMFGLARTQPAFMRATLLFCSCFRVGVVGGRAINSVGATHAARDWLSVMCSLLYVLPVDRVRVCRCSILVVVGSFSCFTPPNSTVRHIRGALRLQSAEPNKTFSRLSDADRCSRFRMSAWVRVYLPDVREYCPFGGWECTSRRFDVGSIIECTHDF